MFEYGIVAGILGASLLCPMAAAAVPLAEVQTSPAAAELAIDEPIPDELEQVEKEADYMETVDPMIPTVNIYARMGAVVELNTEEDYFTIEDTSGNLWMIDNVEDWEVGDLCALAMNNVGTPSIYDDEIISATYCGRVE